MRGGEEKEDRQEKKDEKGRRRKRSSRRRRRMGISERSSRRRMSRRRRRRNKKNKTRWRHSYEYRHDDVKITVFWEVASCSDGSLYQLLQKSAHFISRSMKCR